MAEVLQVQTCQKRVDAVHYGARRIFAQHLPGAGLEVDAVAHQSDAIGTCAEDADVAIGIANVVE